MTYEEEAARQYSHNKALENRVSRRRTRDDEMGVCECCKEKVKMYGPYGEAVWARSDDIDYYGKQSHFVQLLTGSGPDGRILDGEELLRVRQKEVGRTFKKSGRKVGAWDQKIYWVCFDCYDELRDNEWKLQGRKCSKSDNSS